jgi:iron uptake system component EfeO
MKPLIISMLILAAIACGDTSDSEYRNDVITAMHDSIAADLADLAKASRDLQAAAPTPAGRGWDIALDAPAITAMKAAWRRARVAYEHVEGATAPIFPDLDFVLDARYDDYLAELGGVGDPSAFDADGVIGMHGIERVLFAPEIRQEVITFESPLPGYRPPAFPATAAEAIAFKTELTQKLIDDADKLREQWQPAAIDIGAAYQGLVGLMNEQREKVNKAATGEEESRYADVTLFDLRNNLDGARKVYALFRDWIGSKDGGDPDRRILRNFGDLTSLYEVTTGDALPAVPETWSSDRPTPADLATPFGKLWSQVQVATDPNLEGSIVFEMNDVARLLGFPQFVEM